MPEGKWPLIPDVEGLTKFVEDNLLKESEVLVGKTKSIKESYTLLLSEIKKTDNAKPNIEDILSFVRGMKKYLKGHLMLEVFQKSNYLILKMQSVEKLPKS